MIKQAIEYIVGLGNKEVVDVNGKQFSTGQLHRLDQTPSVDAITVRSLSGMVDYIKSNFDHSKELMVHVESPTSVKVYDALDWDNRRQMFIQATAMLPQISFDRFQNTESFSIMLQSCFVPNEHRAMVLQVISSIVEDESVNTTDDGITQRVTAKVGVAQLGLTEIPNPVKLKPFRTFVEVTQPESEFILRVRKGPESALFEADGAAWELNAMRNIEEYLQNELKELVESGKVHVIA